MSDIALVTTTINVPTVLEQYRACDADVLMIVAGDLKTPHTATRELCERLGNAVYLDPGQQEALGYRCSPVIGWNTIQRRNIAILEAVRAGAAIILTVDDDNEPMDHEWFTELRSRLAGPVDVPVMQGLEWFDWGLLAHKRSYRARGVPYDVPRHLATALVERVRLGVFNSLVIGDPDTSAVHRLECAPEANDYNQPPMIVGDTLEVVAVDPHTTWTAVNSQSTAWVRELAPLMALPPGLGRFDDEWGGLIAQRVMQATDYHIGFGRPYVYQHRNPHNIYRDIRDELYGMEHTERFIEAIKGALIESHWTTWDNLKRIVDHLAEAFPDREFDWAFRFYYCWLEDIAHAMARGDARRVTIPRAA